MTPRGPRRRARPSSLAARPQGRKESGHVVGGRLVEGRGAEDLVARLAEALAARGGEIDRATHRFHTYPARMHPDAARTLVMTLGGQRVLDPFCGGGTVLVEALLAGRRAVGRDISPVAILVAHARTRLIDPRGCRALEDEAQAIARAAGEARVRIPDLVYRLRDWYAPHVLRELSALSHLVDRAAPERRPVLRAIHSSLVIKLSRRASDTSGRRVETRYPPGAARRAFGDRGRELARMLGELFASVPAEAREADVALGDARKLEVEAVDLVCTSPPYPATYDYVPLQELRLAWLGEGSAAEAKQAEIGARRGFRRSIERGYASWIADTRRWIQSVASCLSDGGRLAVLIGDGIAGGHLLEARRPTEEAAAAAGLALEGAASIERVDPALRLAKREHALVFRRAEGRTRTSEPS